MNLHTGPRHWGKNYVIVSEDNYQLEIKCYPCSICNKCVAKMEVIWENGLNYCWECYEEAFSQKCVFCNKRIKGSNEMNFVYYNNEVWHSKCFSRRQGG